MKTGGGNSRSIKDAARSLRAKPGWDPSKRANETTEERLKAALIMDRSERLYGAAETCEACEEARKETRDETALCEKHFEEAMG
jgi:hypothetical protein